MGPRDGAIFILADSMGVLGDIDTYVRRHSCNVERLQQSGVRVPLQDEHESVVGDAWQDVESGRRI